MTERERILGALAGARPDRMAWVPRLEFWLRGRRHSKNLPSGFEDLTLPQLIARLGVGWYGTIPDFTDCDDTGGNLDRTLGILQSTTLPYRVVLEGVDRRVTTNGGETVVEYATPVGSIRTASTFTEEMRQAGASTSWITGHAIREPRDIEVVGYIFSHLKVVPAPEGYLAFRQQVGDKGIAVALTSGAACPVQHMMRTLMSVEDFFYTLADTPERIQWLAEQMAGYYRSIQEIAASLPGEAVMLGGNYDATMTPPPFFREHILPHLKAYADTLHRRGKYLMTHTDGENRSLLALYLEAGVDIADSVCPAPMTKCDLAEIRDAFAGRITVWGGIPSVVLCPHSFGWDAFKRFVDALLERYGHESHFVLGVSDMVTADAELDRVQYITEKVQALG